MRPHIAPKLAQASTWRGSISHTLLKGGNRCLPLLGLIAFQAACANRSRHAVEHPPRFRFAVPDSLALQYAHERWWGCGVDQVHASPPFAMLGRITGKRFVPIISDPLMNRISALLAYRHQLVPRLSWEPNAKEAPPAVVHCCPRTGAKPRMRCVPRAWDEVAIRDGGSNIIHRWLVIASLAFFSLGQDRTILLVDDEDVLYRSGRVESWYR